MIPLNDFQRQWAVIEPAALAAVERVGRSGWYILGREVAAFEQTLARQWQVGHALGVANGMDAIEIGLRALGLRAGEKVLTTPFSAFATTLAILRAGGVPVFADVDDNGNIDLDQCRDVFARDASVRAFVPVHLYGNPLDLDRLAALTRDFDVRVVEDCAQSIGAEFGGRGVGTIGQAAAVSFYPTKNLGALGDGGALLTNDAGIASRAKALRNYGQSAQYVHDECGLNSRLDELHAAILADAMLPRLAEWTATRRKTAAAFISAANGSSLSVLRPAVAAVPVWHLFPVFVAPEKLDALRSHFAAAGVQTAQHYPRVIPDQPALATVKHEIACEPVNARKLAASELSIPVHPFLAPAEIDAIAGAIRGWPPHERSATTTAAAGLASS